MAWTFHFIQHVSSEAQTHVKVFTNILVYSVHQFRHQNTKPMFKNILYYPSLG